MPRFPAFYIPTFDGALRLGSLSFEFLHGHGKNETNIDIRTTGPTDLPIFFYMYIYTQIMCSIINSNGTTGGSLTQSDNY